MKKLFLLTMALLLLMGTVNAQEKVSFTGVTYNDEFALTAGIGIPLGGGLWSLDYVTATFSGTQRVGAEIAYLRSYDDGGFYYGILGGVNADWQPTESGYVNYISESTGAVVGYKQLYGWAKYRQQLEKASNYENNFSFGFGYKGAL